MNAENLNCNEALIEVTGLRKHYGSLHVLNGIDTVIRKGEKISIIGPSGSGKSTFLRCLNCLEDPDGGVIMFGGENLADPRVNINKHRRQMCMVFQQFNLFNNKTVLQNIMLAPVYLRTKKAGGLFAKKEIKKLIKQEELDRAAQKAAQDAAEKDGLTARLHALQYRVGESPVEDTTSREYIAQLEREHAWFVEMFEKNWKLTKKRIRKDILWSDHKKKSE